jgi:transposase-like protein
MDPATTFCPNLVCPARGQTGQGNIRIHSCKDQRFLCTECHKTFSATKGTALYRLRTSAETVSLVVTLMAHGCPLQAIVVAFGYDERTVACWLARAGVQGQGVASDDLAEDHQVAVRLLVVIQQEPNGASPSHVPSPTAQRLRRLGGTRSHHPLYLHAFRLVGVERKRRIEGRVKGRVKARKFSMSVSAMAHPPAIFVLYPNCWSATAMVSR